MKNLIFTIIFAFAAQFAMANGSTDTTMIFVASAGAFGEVVGSAKGIETIAVNSPEYVRRAKELSKDFTGYKIELVTVYNSPLALNDELFQTFGGITFEKRSDNSFTYLLGGNFDDKKAVEAFLTDVVKAKYPNAKGVKYNKGKVVKFK